MATKKATPAQLAARKLFAQRAKAGLLKKKPKASRDYARDAAVERAEAELRLAKKIAVRRKTNPSKKSQSTKSLLYTSNRPIAAYGLKSYRYKGAYGYIMIGAKNDDDALKEAHRSVSYPVAMENLEAWDGKKYVSVLKQNPRKKTVSQKISQLTHEGYPQKQAVAVALSEMRKGKVKSNPRSALRKSKVSAVVLMNNPSAKNASAKGYSNWKYCVEAKRMIPGGHVFESIAAFNTKSQAEDYKKAILAAHKNVTLRIKTYK